MRTQREKKAEQYKARHRKRKQRARNLATEFDQSGTRVTESHTKVTQSHGKVTQSHSSVRQRSWEVRKVLAKSPNLKAKTIVNVVRRVAKSPTSKAAFRQALSHSRPALDAIKECLIEESVVKQNEEKEMVAKRMKRIGVLRAKKKHCEARGEAMALKSKFSVSEVAKMTGLKYSLVYAMLHWKGKKMSWRKVSVADKNRVKRFFLSNSITMQLPYRRYAKYYYMRLPMIRAHKEYQVEMQSQGQRALSYKATRNILPDTVVKTQGDIPVSDCLCPRCSNSGLIADAVTATGVNGLESGNVENVVASLCPIEDPKKKNCIWEYKKECITRQCDKCGVSKLLNKIMESNPAEKLDLDKPTFMHQWQTKYKWAADPKKPGQIKKVKDRYDKYRIPTTLGRVLALFIQFFALMSLHVFNFRWMYRMFAHLITTLRRGEVAMVLDYGQNIVHKRAMEVHSAGWTRKQSTIHPVGCFFLCPEPNCQEVVTDEVMFITDDLWHDAHASTAFETETLNHLIRNKVPLQKVFEFCDNCGVQYKSCLPFELLSKYPPVITRFFFGENHGKSYGDSMIGRFVRQYREAVSSRQADIGNGMELIYWAKKTLETRDVVGQCQHKRSHYYFIPLINHKYTPQFTTVPGTMKFHSVASVGTFGKLKVRRAGCTCM